MLPRPRRRPRAVLALAVPLAAAAVLGGCATPAGPVVTDRTALPAAFARAAVATDGAVRVEPAPPGTAPSVERTVHTDAAGGIPPALAVRTDGDGLTVDGRCGDDCLADLVVRIPGGTPVSVDTTAGSVAATGTGSVVVRAQAGAVAVDHVAGDAVVRSQAGAVSVSDVTGRVTAASQAGAVDARRVEGPVEADTQAGPVVVDALVPTDVTARSSAADVTVTVPPGAYRVDARDIDGAQAAIPDDPAGRWTLRAETTAGQARVAVR